MRLYGGVRLLGSGPSIPNVQKLDRGAMPMISAMSRVGMQVDLTHFANLEKALVQDMDSLHEQVKSFTGRYTNLDSGDQVSELLYKTLGLIQARPRFTKSGDRESVDNEALVAIQHDHPIVPLVLQYKELSKLLGTYVRPMPKLAKRTKHGVWRMYPNFATTRVPSGRLSCKEPNLLAIPTRTERGRDIRRGFITDTGWVYVSTDESQIEGRIAAHSSGDENLRQVYENEEDGYSDYAITAFRLEDNRYQDSTGWHYPSVHRMDHRYPAKTCFLAAIYDVSAMGLQEQMPVICANCSLEATKHTCSKFRALWTEDKCQELLNFFYLKYPGILRDRKVHHARARKYGFAWDMWGRILHSAAVRSVLPWVVSGALREVGNFPYQAGAQGTIKLTMAALSDDLKGTEEVIHPLLQVHDELLFECREDVAQELIELGKWRFETCAPLKVPIKASGAHAQTWGDLDK